MALVTYLMLYDSQAHAAMCTAHLGLEWLVAMVEWKALRVQILVHARQTPLHSYLIAHWLKLLFMDRLFSF